MEAKGMMEPENAQLDISVQALVVSMVWLALQRHMVCCLALSFPPELKYMFEESWNLDEHKSSSKAHTLKNKLLLWVEQDWRVPAQVQTEATNSDGLEKYV